MSTEPTFSRDDSQHRYLADLDGRQVGFIIFQTQGDIVVLPHTEVDPSVEGRGIGSGLTRFALDDVRERGQYVVPQCPFVAAWIGRHPEYAALVYRPGIPQ